MAPRKKYTKCEAYIIPRFRQSWRWADPGRKEAMERAFAGRKDGVEYYRCEKCKKVVPRSQKEVDHVDAVGGLVRLPSGALDWNRHWERLMVPASSLVVLCKVCHRKKTNADLKEMRSND